MLQAEICNQTDREGVTSTDPALITTETIKEFHAMTKLRIDSKSPKFDRRKVLSGTAALSLSVFPSISNAGETPAFAKKQAWIDNDTNNEMLDLMIDAARCSEISMDLIVDIVKPLRRDIAVHVCQTIIEFEKARNVEWYVYRRDDDSGPFSDKDIFVKKPARICGYRQHAIVRNV